MCIFGAAVQVFPGRVVLVFLAGSPHAGSYYGMRSIGGIRMPYCLSSRVQKASVTLDFGGAMALVSIGIKRQSRPKIV